MPKSVGAIICDDITTCSTNRIRNTVLLFEPMQIIEEDDSVIRHLLCSSSNHAYRCLCALPAAFPRGSNLHIVLS